MRMKKKKLKHQKRAANDACNYVDHWELVFDYYPGTLKQRARLKPKFDPPTLQAMLAGLKFKKD